MAPILSILFLLGLVIGSFLNVVIHRLPHGQSVVRPRSRCPLCGTPVKPYDNIPVLSWVLLRGRCRDCHGPISPRYPVVELLTGALFALTGFRILTTFVAGVPGYPYAWLATGLAFVASLIAVAFIDLDHQIIPNRITYPGILIGLATSFVTPLGPAHSLVGAGLGFGSLWLLAFLYHRFTGIEGMGAGDVKLAGMLGAFLGPIGVFLTLFLASFVGAIAGVLVMLRKGTGRRTAVPFGAFLAPSGIFVFLYGDTLLRLYLHTFLH